MSVKSEKFNYDEVFIRDVTLGVIGEFYRKIRWINTWDNKQKLITVPVYYGLGGDERFLLDAFIDDIIGKRPELNYDPIPRAHLTIDNINIKKDEFSNPNVYLEYEKVENDGTLKRLKSKMNRIPLELTFNMEIQMNTEIDSWKATQSIWDWLWSYKFFYITYNSMRIDCVYSVPDTFQTDIQRQITLDTKFIKKINFSFSVHTEYPIPNQEQKPIVVTKNKVRFFGDIRTLKNSKRGRYFLGGKN